MRIRFTLLVAALLPAMALQPLLAEEGAANEEGELERCINTRFIRSTSVENDRNIVFFMRGNKIYLNTLPSECRGLSREGRFSYVSYSNRLCRSDRINVMSDSGFGVHYGRSCKLGMFRPVTKEDLADLFDRPDQPIKTKEVEAPEVEDVVAEEDESAEEDSSN